MLVAAGRVSHASAADLAAALERAISDSSKGSGVMLDLQHVDYLSSAGVTAIEAASRRCAATSGTLVLVAPSSPVRMTLDLAGVFGHVAIEPSRALAAERIGASRVS